MTIPTAPQDLSPKVFFAAEHGALLGMAARALATRTYSGLEPADLVSRAYLKALNGFNVSSREQGLIYAKVIIRSALVDELRRIRRRPTVTLDAASERPDHRPTAPELLAKRERDAAVREALRQLAPMYREVLDLYHFQDFKYQEIADTLSLPLGTVMNRIFRARAKLRTMIPASVYSPATAQEATC
jgi:RNA polymerase sigma-70 factor (ECF subfamily)